MCGPAGSGKSTYAHRLEELGLERLSFDTEAWNRGIRHMPLEPAVRKDIESELRRRLVALVTGNQDVVLDFSFWSRAMREEWRRLLEPWDVVPETVYVLADRATCVERVAGRSRSHADDFTLDPAAAASYFDNFEPPTPDEGPLTIIRT